jgi:hypothetical protein
LSVATNEPTNTSTFKRLLDWALEEPPLTRTDIERAILDAEIRVETATSDLPDSSRRGRWSALHRWVRRPDS